MKKISALLLVWVFTAGMAFSLEKAPHFETVDYKGNSVDSADFIGKNPTLLIFWAEWCVYCREEMKKLIKLHERYAKNGLKILALNRDTPDSQAKVDVYLNELNPPFPMIMKTKRIPYSYKALTIPFIVIINSRGEIVDKGFSLDNVKPSLDYLLSKL